MTYRCQLTATTEQAGRQAETAALPAFEVSEVALGQTDESGRETGESAALRQRQASIRGLSCALMHARESHVRAYALMPAEVPKIMPFALVIDLRPSFCDSGVSVHHRERPREY